MGQTLSMKQTILITGGSGFIGRDMVILALQKTDWNIVVLDSLTYAGDLTRLLQDTAYDPQRVKVLWHDLRSPINDSLTKDIGPVDWIVNIASHSHVENAIQDPVPFFMNNCALVAHMLEFARVVKPKMFIQISTDEVYGPAEAPHAHKEWEVHLPSNPYSASKSAQEALAFAYWRTYGVPVVITNTMNNFGEGQNFEKFIPLCVKKIMAGETITVHGSWQGRTFVSGSRHWLHAGNHADAILFLLKRGQHDTYPDSCLPSKWHIVGEKEVTNLDLVYKIEDILGKKAVIETVDFHSCRPGHDLRYALDGSKLAAAGWKAPLDFDQSFLRAVRGHITDL